MALSGWPKFVRGLDPQKTFNIHPALLSQLGGRFGGLGMYSHHVHQAVKKAMDAGEINESGPTMHFIPDEEDEKEYDRGPIFFEYPVPLVSSMDAEDIGELVNQVEHLRQPQITNMVIHNKIAWDGKDPRSLVVPEGYRWLPRK